MEQEIYKYAESMQEEISFDRHVITTVRYSGSARPVIESLLKDVKKLETEIQLLKSEHKKFQQLERKEFIIINDDEASERIIDLINQFKNNQKMTIDVIDILTIFNIPLDQLERIMNKLEKEKIILSE